MQEESFKMSETGVAPAAERRDATVALTMSTVAFAVSFAGWLIYGVLLTWLVDTAAMPFSRSQLGWLLSMPVLTGSVLRLPVGVLTDRFGGRAVMAGLMLVAAVPLFLVSLANNFADLLWCGLGFGLLGATFAAGVAYVSTWYPPSRAGMVLGIFGAGNAGAAVNSMCGPQLLHWLTKAGAEPEGWRQLPRLYAVVVAITAIVFWCSVKTRRGPGQVSLAARLAPLRRLRVWRFGLYYFLLFGGFVALSQWMIPYSINSYAMSIESAGFLAAAFSLPSALIRILGGWLSDRFGARSVMYWVLVTVALCCALLVPPRMWIESPGQGVLAPAGGEVTRLTPDAVELNETAIPLRAKPADVRAIAEQSWLLLPTITRWQEPVVEVGQTIQRRQLLARGTTLIYFQANIAAFTVILCVAGFAMGIGMAAVYKHIPTYFPESVGVTGGIVGVIGGLGGVAFPILFGYLLDWTGLWTSCWFFLAVLSVFCLTWMHVVVQRILSKEAPKLAQRIDHG